MTCSKLSDGKARVRKTVRGLSGGNIRNRRMRTHQIRNAKPMLSKIQLTNMLLLLRARAISFSMPFETPPPPQKRRHGVPIPS